MNRRTFLSAVAAGAIARRPSRAAAPPNIIVILADDLGYGDIGCYGSGIPTPNLDRMAGEGTRFTNYYSSAPVCTPARAGLLTGRYAQRMELGGVLMPNAPAGLPDDETTIPKTLKAAGYTSACIGKWHLGGKPENRAVNRGFDEFFGIPYSHDMAPLPLIRNRTVVDEQTDLDTLTARFTTESLAFIKRNNSNPFFLFLAHAAPHIPLVAGRSFRGMSTLGPYGDVVMEMDWSCGQILNALVEHGIDNNTLVIFTSDNGPWYEGTAGRLRGRKGETWDGGMKVPFLARFPGQIREGQVSKGIASSLDLMPTLARLSGVPLPPKPLDGVDIWPLLTGEKDTVLRNPLLYFDGIHLQAVRMDNWKLHVTRQNGFPWVQHPPGGRVNLPLCRAELYNLDQDPTDSANMASERPQVVARIMDAIDRMLPSFPHDVQDAWQETQKLKVFDTPSGALPVLAPPPKAVDPVPSA